MSITLKIIEYSDSEGLLTHINEHIEQNCYHKTDNCYLFLLHYSVLLFSCKRPFKSEAFLDKTIDIIWHANPSVAL